MNIRVFGMVHPSICLIDIQVDVPFETTVEIPSEQALVSKDLWRAISSKQVFQLSKSPNPVLMSTNDHELRDKIQALTAENEDLRQKLLAKHAEVDAMRMQQATLDNILAKLTSGVSFAQPTVVLGTTTSQGTVAVDASTPLFIPSSILPETAESHIETTKTESDTGVSGAAGKLREMKGKNKA